MPVTREPARQRRFRLTKADSVYRDVVTAVVERAAIRR